MCILKSRSWIWFFKYRFNFVAIVWKVRKNTTCGLNRSIDAPMLFETYSAVNILVESAIDPTAFPVHLFLIHLSNEHISVQHTLFNNRTVKLNNGWGTHTKYYDIIDWKQFLTVIMIGLHNLCNFCPLWMFNWLFGSS